MNVGGLVRTPTPTQYQLRSAAPTCLSRPGNEGIYEVPCDPLMAGAGRLRVNEGDLFSTWSWGESNVTH